MSSSRDPVAVLGGGISGLTTALTLKLLGARVRLIAAEVAGDRSIEDTSPRFATPYAAASVLPHSVHSRDLGRWFAASQAVFRLLSDHPAPPVRRQEHLEIFEREPERPAYLAHLEAVGPFGPVTPGHELAPVAERQSSPGPGSEEYAEDPEEPRSLVVPGRPEVDALYGWSCRIHFAEQPRYLRYLRNLLERLEIPVDRRELDREAVDALPEPLCVDCLGASAPEMFGDDAEMKYLRGLLVHARPQARAGAPTSYNYVPHGNAPAGFERPRDLYFYPRRDRWILGGTRQVGPVDRKSRSGSASETGWTGETFEGPLVRIDGREVPEPIVRVNRGLVRQLTGVDLDLTEARVHEGYRFLREPVRLEPSSTAGGTLVHNYGHGGAGVTLSWGCALAVAELVFDRKVSPNELGNALGPIL